MPNTDDDWEYWGRNDAYFGVLRDDRFRTGTVGENRDTFFATGHHQIAHRLAHLESLLGPIARKRALDFGCGVGRMTQALAAAFENVTGLDVSQSMLEEAQANAAAHGLPNITYALSDADLSDAALSHAQGRFDFVHTYIVLQHISRARGMAIIPRLLDLVAPGGVASLHICIRRDIGWWKAATHWLRHTLTAVQGLTNMAHGRAWKFPPMQMNPYPLADVLAAFADAGMDTTIVDMERHGDFLTAYVAARRR